MTELVMQLGRKFQYLRFSKIMLFSCILTLFFFEQTREILLFSASDAYVAVSSFVGVTLIIFVFLEKRNFNLQRFIEKNKSYEIPTSAFLGVIPGCGGAIMVMSLYTRGVVSFGSVLAALIATMGDAAFLLIASKPQAALVILPVTFLTGIVFGYLVKPFTKNFINKISLKKDLNKNLPKNKIPKNFYSLWLICLIPGIILGVLNAFQIEISFYIFGIDLIHSFSFILAMYCILLWVFNPLTDIQMASIHENSLRRVADTTCFVTVWVIIAFVTYELIDLSTKGLIFDSLKYFGPFIPLMAIIIGFIPGCGPQIIITSTYLMGIIPLSAQIGNAISNDGDALFPVLAISPKVGLIATLYSAVPAIIVSYGYLLIFE